VLAKARRRVERWLVDGSAHPRYAEAWRRVLAQEPEQVAESLVDPGETMRALRQSSPFAGALDPRERWRILRRLPINRDAAETPFEVENQLAADLEAKEKEIVGERGHD